MACPTLTLVGQGEKPLHNRGAALFCCVLFFSNVRVLARFGGLAVAARLCLSCKVGHSRAVFVAPPSRTSTKLSIGQDGREQEVYFRSPVRVELLGPVPPQAANVLTSSAEEAAVPSSADVARDERVQLASAPLQEERWAVRAERS